LIQERRKYNPLGFHQIYDWPTNDLEISQKQLNMFLDTYEQVPFKIITLFTGEINHSGIISHDWNQHALLSILHDLYIPDVMNGNYQFTENAHYLSLPEQSHKLYINCIKEFTLNHSTDMFGFHANS
jgi:dynein heavy chain